MYIGFYSDTLAGNQITDYLLRVDKQKLQSVPGVQTAEILGERQFALRRWLDPDKLATHGLTAPASYAAIDTNHNTSALGVPTRPLVTLHTTPSTTHPPG